MATSRGARLSAVADAILSSMSWVQAGEGWGRIGGVWIHCIEVAPTRLAVTKSMKARAISKTVSSPSSATSALRGVMSMGIV